MEAIYPPSSLYEFPGIDRDEDLCSYETDWQAYQCVGVGKKMMVIESMDDDTGNYKYTFI